MRRFPAVPHWQALLPSMRTGRCDVLQVADLLARPLPDPLSPTRAAYVLACPATTPTGDLFGAVFIVFGTGDRPPRGAELRRLRLQDARIASQIAAVLDLVGQGRTPSPYAEAA